MITEFYKYKKDSDIDPKLLKGLFLIAYHKAIKHFNRLKPEFITEDHVLEFINQYMLNNYSIDLPHSKQMYNYVKHLLHRKFFKDKS